MKIKLLSIFILCSFCLTLPYQTLALSSSSSGISIYCIHSWNCYQDHKLTAGVGDYGNNKRYYWVDSNFSSNYKDRIDYAFEFWTYTSDNPGVTTPISIKKTSLKSDSTFDIYRGNISGTVTGFTDCYYYSTLVTNLSESDWTWAEIYIDQAKTVSYPNSQRVGLVGHEIGHAMGLTHQPYKPTSSIMFPTDMERKFQNGNYRSRPATIDCETINHIY